MTESGSSEERFSALADEFVERHRLGQKPSIEGYAAAHPDLADEIRRAFPALVMMEEFKPGSGDVTGDFEAAAVVVRGARLERLGDFRVLREAGPRRHGGGLRGRAGVARPAGRAQGPCRPRDSRPGAGEAVRARGPRGGPVAPHQHRAGLRRRRAGGAALLRDAVHPGARAGQRDRGGQAAQVRDTDERSRRSARRPSSRRVPVAVAPTAAGIARSLVTEHFASAHLVADEPSTIEASRPDELGMMTHSPRPMVKSADLSSEVVLGPIGAVVGLGIRCRVTGGAWRGSACKSRRRLEYAHTQGIFHRDIKPSNLLLDAQGTAWVADFGLAKAVEGDDLTHTGDIVGTIRYMAPERFHGRCDARSDVYALGLTLYEMVALRPAFEQAARQALIRQVMEEEPPRLRKLEPWRAARPGDDHPEGDRARPGRLGTRRPGRWPRTWRCSWMASPSAPATPARSSGAGSGRKRRPAIAALLAGLIVAVLTG